MKISIDRLHKDVEFLTSIYPYRNHKNVDSLNKAANYIEEEFRKARLPVMIQSWEANGNEYKNVIAQYRPDKTSRLIVGAHYDVFKDQPGADDNASGVAAILEMARLTIEIMPDLDYGIDFIAYSLEEPPFFKKKEMGSYVHAQSIIDNKHEYIGMIALEMVGYFRGKPEADKNQKSLFVSGIRKFESFNRGVSDLIKTPQFLNSRSMSFADDYVNNGPSDHRNYWSLDIPAVMIIGSGGDRNPHYHRKTDTIDTLDFHTMKQAVESLAYMIFNISSIHTKK